MTSVCDKKMCLVWESPIGDASQPPRPVYPPVGLRIVTLPKEFRTEEEVMDLVEKHLGVGAVAAVKIASHSAGNSGARFFSATVDLNSWNDGGGARALLNICVDPYNGGKFDTKLRVDIDLDIPISWDNGKPMSHLTVHLVDAGSSAVVPGDRQPNMFRPLELAEGEWSSLHIPILPGEMYMPLETGGYTMVGERTLANIIETKLQLGKVKRIDFVTRDDLPAQPPIKAAFVHFDYWFDNKNAKFLRNRLNQDGNFRQKGVFDRGQMWNFEVYDQTSNSYRPAYFVFKINHRPIPDAEASGLNIHQLAAAKARLESEVNAMAEEISALRSQLEFQQVIPESVPDLVGNETDAVTLMQVQMKNEQALGKEAGEC